MARMGGLPTFANPLANGLIAPIPDLPALSRNGDVSGSCFPPARAIAYRPPANPKAARHSPVLQLFSYGRQNSADRRTIKHARFVATVHGPEYGQSVC
jgi:hypothetical protein